MNAMNNYLKYKICVVGVGNFLLLMLINMNILNLSQIYFSIPEMSKRSRFEYIITFWICVLVLWIHKGYFVVKIWCEILIINFSGIQKIIIEFLYVIKIQNKCFLDQLRIFNNMFRVILVLEAAHLIFKFYGKYRWINIQRTTLILTDS